MFNYGLFPVALFILSLLLPLHGAEGSTYYIPYCVLGKGAATGVGISNLSTTSKANATVKVYDQSGRMANMRHVQIEPEGQWSDVLDDSVSGEGWILVDSDRSLAGLCFAVKDDCMMYVPLSESLSKKLMIPHASQNFFWDTVVHVANPNGQMASGTLWFRDTEGNEVARRRFEIPALGSARIPLSVVLGKTEASGGSVLVESDRAIAGFALFQNRRTGQYWCNGINATPLDISDFDGVWTGVVDSSSASGKDDGSCSSEKLSVSVEVYRNTFEGTAVNASGESLKLKGAVTYEGAVYGIALEKDEQEASFTGKAFGDQIFGKWIGKDKCRLNLNMDRQ